MKEWSPGWWLVAMTVEAGAILSWKDSKVERERIEEIDRRRIQGAAFFRRCCEAHTDLDPKAKEIMQFEMDKLLDKTQGRTR